MSGDPQFFVSWNHYRVEFAWLSEGFSEVWRMAWQSSLEPDIWEL